MRIDGWENRLNELIKNSRNQSFEYGRFDCCLLACDVVKALTGKDIRADIIPDQYASEGEANQIISRYGGIEDMVDHIANLCNFRPIPRLFAQRGDIVLADLTDLNGRKLLGICMGKHVFFPSPSKLERLNITSKILTKAKAWRIQ